LGLGLGGITGGPDGNVWFSEPGFIDRITPQGAITQFAFDDPRGLAPNALTTGPDGNVWFADNGNVAVGNINPNTGAITEFPVPSAEVPSGIAVGPNGNLFFGEESTHQNVSSGIGEVTPDGTFTEFNEANVNAIPNSITTGPDGKVWFADQGRNRIVQFIDDGLSRTPFRGVATFRTDVSPFTVHTADLRGNGTLDLVTGNRSHFVGPTEVPGSVSVLLGSGDGTFQSHVDYAAGFSPRAVAIGDFTGDGIPDLVVADEGSFDGHDPLGGLRILRGNGDGTFQPAQDILTGQNVGNVVAGDFSGTGHLDLIVTTAAGVSELRGNGDGTFQATVSITAQTGKLTVGDFNHDGNLDLVVAGLRVQVFLGNGDGTFQLSQTFDPLFSSSGVRDVLAADLRGNGTLDLVMEGGFGDTPEVALGNGDGTFGTPSRLPGLGFDSGIAVGDFSGDGIPDLVFGLSQDQGVELLKGNGDGTFRFRGAFFTGANPFAVAAGDFNGDGLPDIVAANSFGASVGVLISIGAGFGGGGGFGGGTAPGAHQPGAGRSQDIESALALRTEAHPSALPAPSPAAESSRPAERMVVDFLFAIHQGEFAGFLRTAAHRKALAQGSGDGLDPLTDDLGLLASAVS
jgi:hypothetical protein